jgi:ABC-2 type transport system permease protein
MMAVIAFALTSIGLIIAWRMESTQGFHVIVNMILIPVWLLSGAFFPQTGVPAWLEWPMWLNPLSYGMSALRQALYLGEAHSFQSIAGLGWSIAISTIFAAVTFAMAAQVARRSSPV